MVWILLHARLCLNNSILYCLILPLYLPFPFFLPYTQMQPMKKESRAGRKQVTDTCVSNDVEGWWHKLKCSSALATYQLNVSPAQCKFPDIYSPLYFLRHSPVCVVTNSVTKLLLPYSNIFLPIYDFNVFSYFPRNNLVLFLDYCAALNPTLGAVFNFFTLLPNFSCFHLLSCFFHIFYFLSRKSFFFLLLFSALCCHLPFLAHSVLSFPLTSPSFCCLLPLVNGQSLSFTSIHYFCWLLGRQIGSAIGVSSAYNYLCREENVQSTGTVTYRKPKGYLHSWVVS